MNPVKFISIEGPIGVGKTSLAQKMADRLGGDAILEQPESNPFLKSFYLDKKNSALATQLFFLFQRAQQLEAINSSDMFSTLKVSDFIVQKDKLFAELTLTSDEIKLYNKIYDSLEIIPPKPDLVIYLQAPPNVLLARINNRGADYEKKISLDYLDRLCKIYAQFFYHYDESPMLIVNASSIDPISREHHFEALLGEIEKIKFGRHFFNPSLESIA
jgi:deoxyguanosine kinase